MLEFHSYFYCSASLVCNIALPKRYIHEMAGEMVERRRGELYSGVRAASDVRLFNKAGVYLKFTHYIQTAITDHG